MGHIKKIQVTSLYLLALRLSLIHGYKIKRSDCHPRNGSETVVECTCGGIGDPFSIILNKGPKPELGVPYYGTRFGHNLAHQLKQTILDYNLTGVTELHYADCPNEPLRAKIDFTEFSWDPFFKMDITNLSFVSFKNIHSVNLYIKNSLSWGNMTVKFENINGINDFGYRQNGSVIIYGHVEYCDNPCSRQPPSKAREEDKTCNDCDVNSSLFLNFSNVDSVLFQDLILTPEKTYGHSYIEAFGVTDFSVEGGRYHGITVDVEAGHCFGWKEETNCTAMFLVGGVLEEDEGVAGVVIGAIAIILVFIAVVGAIAASRLKSGGDCG